MTIEGVARAAGVSAMTVSRVINGGTNVKDATRAIVLEAVARLNYSPNTAARSLAAGTTTHVGLLYANPSAAYLTQFLIGTLEAARRAGSHLIVEACETDDPGEQAEAARRFATTIVEGVVLPPPLSESRAILEELESAGVPIVTVATGYPRADRGNVRMDDCAAAMEMTRHLFDLGHRDIAHIKGHPRHIAARERERGFLMAMADVGLDAATAPMEQGYFTFRSGLEATERLLARAVPPTAIFAGNDDMAAAAISVAHRRGMHVPDDLSVAGFDDTITATTIWPELTTIRQPISAMADAALQMLLDTLAERRAGQTGGGGERVLDHELIVRESTGRAPSRGETDR